MIADNFPDISFIDDATVDEVLTGMINDYQQKYRELTGREASLALADPYRLIMYACAMQIYQAMQYADHAGKMSFLKYAQGAYLDNLGAFRGVRREESTAAATTLQFSMDAPLSSAVSIPAGTRVTNGNDVFFATDRYAEIPAGKTEIAVAATCTSAGVAGNGFAAGEFTVLVNTLPYITAVKNTEATYGGTDREEDGHLKDRIYTFSNSYSTAGPSGAYEYHTKSAAPDISDVIVRSETPGEVDICFICEGGVLPGPERIRKVEEHLNDRSIRPLTDKITVRAPAVQAYDVRMTYYIPTSSKAAAAAIQTDVAEAVSAYNAWQTGKIGRDINPSYLIQKVMEAGAKRVEVESPLFTVLDESTIARTGAVTVSYGGVEDD
ncbi:MAG: baseplate J/gp47 family protein [Lachnospiraceae bacterium]|nr:baseplate J/gp47 family protein [Lachnospiraceae bacterium]